ncbi:MAG: SDR family NAD(P)-dependent oxidoreductase, partial [Thiotrichales bacterium]|nr:SDR family NAD(P)-dependent oxidoreductase [Thiotrichales bacterium]
MKNILVIGATSAIAEQTVRLYAQQGARLYLLARDAEKLDLIAADARVRGATEVVSQTLDVNDFATHQAVLNDAFAALDTVDVVLMAHGTLPDQTACEQSVETTLKELNTNALSTISLLTLCANRLQKQG